MAGPAARAAAKMPRLAALLLFFIATLLWSGNVIIGRLAAGEIGPFSLSFGRWAVALVVIWPIAWRHVRRELSLYRCHFRFVLIVSLLNVAAYNTLVYWGLNYTTAINAAILNAAFPLMVFALTWVTGYERATRYQSAGLVLAVAGALVVAARGKLVILAQMDLNAGDMLILLAELSFALYSVVLRRSPAAFNPIGLIAVQILLGLGFLAPLLMLEFVRGIHAHWNLQLCLLLFYAGIFPSVVSHICWIKGVDLGGANLSGIMYNLIPVLATLLAILILGEAFYGYQGLGIGLIFAGIYLAVFVRGRQRK